MLQARVSRTSIDNIEENEKFLWGRVWEDLSELWQNTQQTTIEMKKCKMRKDRYSDVKGTRGQYSGWYW